ncbi:MAG: hypothetical protein JWM27_2739 [Gemmatimonadetes bacterium]|nr:hypothetical protein [Gemmatimonadota bacterium]
MSLSSILRANPEQLRGKLVRQIIAFAGDGRLLDGSSAASEFREYLRNVPSGDLARYADECLAEKFENGGLALQDIVNQLGRRLGFIVEDGRYRGVAGAIGFDGIWDSPDGHHIVVEVKTTSTFQIELDTIASYRRELIRSGRITEDRSSILIVVGRDQTDDLEAQIRGSRHAWEIRLISVDGLKRLVDLKEDLDDPSIARKVSEILIPYEYTRVDRIIDLVFSATEEVLHDQIPQALDIADGAAAGSLLKPTQQPTMDIAVDAGPAVDRAGPMMFNAACAQRISAVFRAVLLKRSRTLFSSPDESIGVVCLVSKEHPGGVYWYGYQDYARDSLKGFPNAYVAFGCGSPERIIVIPWNDVEQWLGGMNITDREGHKFWHVKIFFDGNAVVLHRKAGQLRVDLSKYLIK